MNLLTFLTLQLSRISNKPSTHVQGPKKPDLQATEKGN